MRAREVMTRDVVAVHVDTPLPAVTTRLLEHSISAVPVIDAQGKPIGIVSELDIIENCLGRTATSLRGIDISSHRDKVAGDIMSTPVVTVEGETPIDAVVGLFEKRGVKRVPVVDNGRLVGIISRCDVLRTTLDVASQLPARLPDAKLRRLMLAELRQALGADAELPVITVSDGFVHFWGAPPSAEALEIVRRVAASQAERID